MKSIAIAVALLIVALPAQAGDDSLDDFKERLEFAPLSPSPSNVSEYGDYVSAWARGAASAWSVTYIMRDDRHMKRDRDGLVACYRSVFSTQLFGYLSLNDEIREGIRNAKTRSEEQAIYRKAEVSAHRAATDKCDALHE